MDADDHICVCYKVSQRKLCHFMNREQPEVASKLSECLDAGTGCGWCVPFLEQMHRQWQAGDTPGLKVSMDVYAAKRKAYKARKHAPPPDEASSSD